MCRRSLLRRLHQCSHHQHRSFLRSSANTHLREIASSSTRPDVVRPKTPPKRPPVKTPPVKSVPKKAKASEPTEIKGSVGRVQPRTPSPKRAVEEMARNDAAARGSAPVRAEVAKAVPAETTEVVTPVSEGTWRCS